MPDGVIGPSKDLPEALKPVGLSLAHLAAGKPDSIGAMVKDVLFRGRDYAIYRSDRGVYVHFSDDKETEHKQRAAYVTLSVAICELRYLTSQMRPSALRSMIGRSSDQDSLYDHNMAQALMLLMESVAQRTAGQAAQADATEKEANAIADRALNMAVQRNTTDNTIRYVVTCVIFGIGWLVVALAFYLAYAHTQQAQYYVLASATGILGAVFSVIVRAQSFDLKPCDDSGMNKLMSLIRIGMGGIAGPVLFLLILTVAANALEGSMDFTKDSASGGFIRMVAIIGLIGGFAERLVPNLVQTAADRMESRAGTPGQAAQGAKKDPPKPEDPVVQP
jgi:hypothetical protein